MKTLHTIYSTFAKHNMAKFLTVLTILFTVGVGSMWGAEVTFTTAAYNGKGGTSGTGGSATSTSSGVTITSTKAYYTSAHIREYSGGTITVSSSNNITKIVFTSTASGTSNYGPSKISLNSGGGSYSYSGTAGTWTGSSTSIKFDCDAQFRWTKIVVTTKDADPYTVTFHTTATKEEDIKEASAGAGVTPPTMEEECGEWEFQGWSESSSNSETSTTPLSLVTLTNGKYYPTEDIDLYPVYTKTEDGGGSVEETLAQTLQYDTWSYSGSTTNKTSYRLFHSNSYVESAEFDLSTLSKVVVYGGTFGGDSYNKLTIAGVVGGKTTTWKSVTVSGSSQTGVNTYTGGTSLSGTGKLRVTSNSGSSSSSGVRISKIMIYTLQATSTTYYYSYPQCTTETAITLYANDGTNQKTDITTGEKTYTVPTCSFTRTGYNFVKWNTKADGTGTDYNPDATINLNGTAVNLYAIWTPIKYTITYNLDGGTNHASNPANYTIETATVSLQDPSKTGHNFGGWYKESTFATQVTQIANGSTGNITLYAKWTAKALVNYRTDCDVVIKCDAYSFHTGDGTIATMEKEENIICFEEHGVAQGGLEHEWQINNYTIPADEKFFVGYYGYFYNDNLGIGDTDGDKSRSVVSDWTNMYLAPSMTSDDPEHSPRLGHAKGAVGTLRIFEDSDWDNLFVGFIPDGYTVKFGETKYPLTMANADNHEYRTELLQYEPNNYANAVSVGVIDENGNYVATANTQEMRHIFLKVNSDWASDNAKFSIYDIGAGAFKNGFMTLVPGSTELYEGWVDKDCANIIFVRHNATADYPSWDNKWNQTGNLSLQANQNMFTIAAWDDQTDAGWVNGTYTKYGKFRMYEDSKAINWYVNFYPYHALTYDKNAEDATGTMDMQFIEADAENKQVLLEYCGFTRPGYRFKNWRKDDTHLYVPNGSNTIKLDEDITLYAIWEKEYTVTYDAKGGTTSCVDNKGYVKAETVIVCDKVPTKTGYTFDGWLRSDNGAKVKEGESFTMPANDVTLTAQWIITQYTVTLNPNYPTGKTGIFIDNNDEAIDGNLVLKFDYNTTSQTLTDLYQSIELEGYQFNGWYSATSGGSKWTATGTITQNVTVYAQWTKVYSVILSENGTTTELEPQTSTSYTLPTGLSIGTCENDEKELVGWSTDAIPNPGDKPTSNFYELGATVTLTKDQTTFYAVFATVEGDGGSAGETTTVAIGDQVVIIQIDDEKTELTGFRSDKLITDNNNYGTYAAYSTTPSATLVWTVEEGANDGTFAFKNGNYYLNLGGNSNYLSCSTTKNTSSSWTVTESSDRAIVTNVMYNSRKIMWNQSSPRFASYAKNHGLNTNQYYYHIKFYKLNGGTSYFDYTTTCVKLPDPVLSFDTEPANPIVFTDAVCGGNSSKQSVTVVGENLRDVVNVSVTGPYKIARTASTALKDFTTSLTLDKTAAGAIHSNYQTVYIISTPPAQSTEATAGTLTFTTTKGNTLIVNLSTPTVTCTQYTLTLVDRGVSTEQPTKYYAGETIDEAPADPEGVCTDPIHYVFDGWAAATVAEGSTAYTKVTFPYTVTGNTKFYAVYRYVEEGSADSGDYVKVTEDLDDYSGDYLIVYETGNVAFDGGRNNVDDELDATSNTIEVTIDNNTIASNATTDAAKFTIAKVDGGYSIQSASGYYIGRSATSNGLSTNETYSANYDLNTITDCKTIKGKGGNILKYNKAADQKRFRYYQSGQETIALYRKAASYLYTTSPVCGPHLVVTEGKEIYVTGGNAGGTRDLVIAQQKVSYKATRLNVGPTSQVPDVKVATNGITVGGVVTSDVKVTIDQNKEQQTDGTYTITGTITVQYQPSANNKQEDIQVQLAVDYNTDAKDNFTVHARSLPSEFVIVAKSGDKWYALNGDMNTNAANPANGQVTLDNDANPTKATYAPCNTIYTFDGVPNTGDRTYVRFQGTDGAWLWAASGTNVGIQNNVLKTTPEGSNKAYNWKLYTEDNITYRFGNANNSRQLTLNGEKFGMYASGVQDIRVLPYVEKCLYNYAPTNLKVSVLKGTYVTLTWDAVAGATKYQYSTNGTTWTDAGTEPTVTINGLIGDTKYTYYIRAYHEDAGVSQECIDYAEITFTTADCDDVPTNITYTADLNSITVSWTAAAPTATITYNTKEDGTGEGGTINNATSPYKISGGLTKNTTYYIQILSDGTCASPIIPVKTEDVEVDIVEWYPQGIIVDVNTDETIGVTLENEVSYGSGLGSLAEDLFFSKYFEGSGSLKMIAIYNGTGKDVDLSEYRIDRGSNGDATKISKTYDLSQLGIIKQGQEIIFYSWPLTSEYSYSCSQSFLDSKVQESGLDANPRWILCDAKTHNGIEFEAMDFSGNDPLLLYKSSELIDVFGVSTEQESPASTQICSGRSDQAWSADGVTNMDYGKTTEDFPNGEIPHGVNVGDETITAYTARVIMFRKNTVVSGKNAVTKNTTTFATFAEEWEARQVCMSGDDGDLTCAAYQELGTFDYSDYYTKYEPMGEGTTFDENARNADGTVTIPITDLYKHACSNIRVKLTNSNGDVLTDREYKVPIMITTTQGTDGQTFLDLQQNLATKEVDSEGNVIDTHPLSLEEVREICKTCDVVVRDNATLTKVTDGTTNDHPQVHDVIVYEGASIVIPDGTDHNYTINSLSLRRKGDEVASAQVQGTGKFVLPADVPVTLSMRIDANNWHWFTLPYDCDIADVTWSDGTPAKYNTDWFLMYYDGESRAASTNPYDNHWKVYSGTNIEAGKGYIIGITGNLAHPKYTFELHFPMAQGVLTAEQTKKTVALNAWGVKSDNTPNNLGWNLVGNPYLDYYKTSENISFTGLSLLKYTGIDPVTGDRLYDDSSYVPFLVTPVDGGWYEYQQELASDVEMMPFTAYFVQVGDPAKASHTNGMELHAEFVSDKRGRMSLIRRAPQEVDGEQEPVIVRVEVVNAKGESDKTTLIIDDRFTNEYEMNADFFKWFGDYYRRYTKPVLYSMGADQGKRAFNALSEQLAAQPVALGMFAAQAGDYTFTLTRKRCDLSRVEEVWLYDATTATYTNLMQQDYTFTTAKTEGEGRFYLSVKMRQNAPTDITDIYGGNIVASAKDGQIIVGGLTDNTQLWIYDATGKLLHTEQTTNFQHVYEVPVVGTYFVRTLLAGQAQTIKVLVE